MEAIANETSLPIANICQVLDLSRSAFYDWQARPPGVRDKELKDLTPSILAIFWHHRRRYGARRISKELEDQEVTCSPKRVSKILKNQGLRAIQPKSFVPKTTDSRHSLGYNPNLLLDAPAPKQVDEKWVGDITYLSMKGGGFCYLASLLDLFSRDLVGWSIDMVMDEPLVLRTLRMAIRDRQPKPGLIHHSDRGGQYAGKEYRLVLRRAGIIQSMSRPGNCYDNAFMESCWSSFKRELETPEYENMAAAKKFVAEYVRYYRFERKHSSLGYRSPHQFGTRTLNQK